MFWYSKSQGCLRRPRMQSDGVSGRGLPGSVKRQKKRWSRGLMGTGESSIRCAQKRTGLEIVEKGNFTDTFATKKR